MDEQVREILERPFEPHEIKYRDGNYGKRLRYVEGHSVIRRLNEASSGEWDFSIIEHTINPEADEVIVRARLCLCGTTKEAFGSAKIKRQRQSGQIVELGSDLKAASTDAIRKCSTLLGLGLHLYQDTGAAEAEEAKHQPEPVPSQRSQSHAGSRAGSQAGATHKHSSRETGQKGTGTVTDKQLNYLRRLAKKHDMSEGELNEYTRRVYAANIEAISKSEASFLIESLRHGEIPYYDNAA